MASNKRYVDVTIRTDSDNMLRLIKLIWELRDALDLQSLKAVQSADQEPSPREGGTVKRQRVAPALLPKRRLH
jgi:hypothetical protein